jgi:uroporphyrinogen decarboxylase
LTTDLMTPLERMTAYNKGEAVDRLPCVPMVGNTAARVIGVKVSELRGNGQLIAAAHIASYRLFRYDIVRIFTDLFTQAEAMGAVIHYPEDETAYLSKPAIREAKEISTLEPANPYRDGNLPQHLEAMKIAVDTIGNEVTVTGAITGPFTNASFLIGTEKLVRLMRRTPEAIHKLCAVSLETSLRYAEAMIDLGCTPSLTDAMSSSSVISPEQFREFSAPYLAKLIEYIHFREQNATLHICGKTNKIWEMMVDTGADCISIDNDVDLAEAKLKVGAKVRLMGNVKPSEIMLQGSPTEIKQAVINCVYKAFDNPKGYIVASGCSLPTETPFVNVKAMIDTVRELGYPIDLEKLVQMNV